MDEARGATDIEATDGDEGGRESGDSDVVVAGNWRKMQRGTDRSAATSRWVIAKARLQNPHSGYATG